MQIMIEISEESYNKLMQKSMLMSASAIEEVVDAVKHGKIYVTLKSCTPILENGVIKWPADKEGD